MKTFFSLTDFFIKMYLINVHERHIHNYTYDQLTIDLVSFQFIFIFLHNITLYILQHITQLDQQVTTGGNRKEGITLEPSLL